MTQYTKNEKLGLLIMRIGLGVFLLLWGIDKLVAPQATQKIFEGFYNFNITSALGYIFGILEIALALGIIFGLFKFYTYGIGLLINLVSIGSSWQQLLSPFGGNHLFIAGIPVLLSFVALFLLRHKDTLYSLDELFFKNKK